MHFLNYLSNNYSSLFLTVPVTQEANCREMKEDAQNSSYPHSLSYFIYCLDLSGDPFLWHLNVTINPSVLIDVSELRQLDLS